MTKDEVKKSATQLLIILSIIEAAGWTLIVLAWTKVIVGPLAPVVMALGIFLVIPCLIGAIWTAIQLAKIR